MWLLSSGVYAADGGQADAGGFLHLRHITTWGHGILLDLLSLDMKARDREWSFFFFNCHEVGAVG